MDDDGGGGAGRAPAVLSCPAMSAVTRPCRTAVSIAAKASSRCRCTVASSMMLSFVSSQTFASKNHIDR